MYLIIRLFFFILGYINVPSCMSIFAHTRMGLTHVYTHMGCPYMYGIALLNLMILACSYIRKSLFHDCE